MPFYKITDTVYTDWLTANDYCVLKAQLNYSHFSWNIFFYCATQLSKIFKVQIAYISSNKMKLSHFCN